MAAAKKDFSAINTKRVYNAIEEATSDVEQMDDTQEIYEEEQAARKPRRTYTDDERLQALETMQTSGRKGCKLPRINLAFSPDNYEYVRTMARARGENLTQFLNHVIELDKEQHRDIYEKALEFRKMF